MARPDANTSRFTFTAQGEDFAVYAFAGHEAVSAPYEFTIELISLSANVDITALLGTPACLSLVDESGQGRPVHGLIREMEQLHTGNRFTHYRAVIVPRLWFLGQIVDHRIFQKLSVPEIINKLLKEQGFPGDTVSFKLFYSYEPREYCVQYGETYLHFISRLCEEEGIYFYFEHTENSHCLCFCDREGGPKITGESDLRFFAGSGQQPDSAVINRLRLHDTVNSNAAAYREWNFTRPRLDLSVKEKETDTLKAPVPQGMLLEQYRYPHLYELRAPGDKYVKLQVLRQLTFRHWIEAEADVCRFLPSYVFTIKEHPRPDANAQWWVVRVQHNGEQPGVLEHEAPSGRGLRYTSQVVAIPAMTRFVPVVQHAKRRVVGAQSAIVTGPKGEEIYPDKYGRVKVQFHWDREGKQDENTTCWIRASQGWAGTQFGTMAIPRIGHEVIASFLEGDPDRPLITGRVYHELNRVPYELPTHKTRTVFKTMSTPGKEGEPRGFNELRIEDKKGEEEIYAHAEKDVNIHVRNDWKEHILRDFHAITDRHTYTLTKGETHETLTKARKTELHANDNLTVHADKHVAVDGRWLGKAGVEIHLKSGVKIVMEAGAELTLKAGGSWLTLSPAGISADGPQVGLNSGGSAGKGTGAVPELPEGSLHYVIEGRLYATAPLKMVTDASVNKQSLTEEEAQVLFNDLKNNPDIPFQYVSDCCYARAHEMCRIMKKRGITSGKTWYYDADGGQTLMIPNPDGTRPLAGGGRWLYHVAPTVRVTGKDGKVIDKVFDPSLFDKPVSIEEWHNIMDLDSPSSARVVKNTGRDIFYIGPHSDRAIYDEDMKETKQAFNQHQDALKAGVI